MVVLVPEPVVVVPPGVLVNVHVPAAGKPLKTKFPVGSVHVGCVIVPTTGAGTTVVNKISFPYDVPALLVAYART